MEFYVVNNHLFDDSAFAFGEDFGDISVGPPERCEVCGSALTLKRWLPPYKIKVSRRKLGDFIYGTFGNFIVSSRFKTHFEKEKLEGIESFRPVKILFRNQLLNDEYYLPEIVLADVPVELEGSGIVFDGDEQCPRCIRAGRVIIKMRGLIFEHPENIQFDIFNPKMITELVVSNRFRDFVDQHEFSNISMIEASQYKPIWIFN